VKRLFYIFALLSSLQAAAYAADPLDIEIKLQPIDAIARPTPDVIPRLTSVEIALAIGKILPTASSISHIAHLQKHEWETLAAFYLARDNAPIWIGGDGVQTRTTSLSDRLARADEDGLNPSDYPLPKISTDPDTAMSRAEAEIMISASAIAYARDARGARIDLARLSKLITPKLDLPSSPTVLANLIGAANPGDALLAYNPPQAGYRVLKEKLATLREMTASIGEMSAHPILQASKKPLKTSTAMVAQDPVTPFDLIANMERWRWVERDLGDRYIEVNLPEFMLHVVDHGKIIHTTRAIVGKQDTPTPLFSEKMQYLIVNPSWHVPYSIVKREFLPKLAEDPEYATKAGYEVSQNGDLVTIRQPPGERNALGFVKFMFPNQHSVYLHDTPTRKLFANTERAYSHGCVRVDEPFSLASVVLDDAKYSTDELKSLIGKGERVIRLKEPLPVQLTYFTVVPDQTGELHHVGDIYGYDQSVEAALGLGQPRTYAALK
jgi:hypothetical protein